MKFIVMGIHEQRDQSNLIGTTGRLCESDGEHHYCTNTGGSSHDPAVDRNRRTFSLKAQQHDSTPEQQDNA